MKRQKADKKKDTADESDFASKQQYQTHTHTNMHTAWQTAPAELEIEVKNKVLFSVDE